MLTELSLHKPTRLYHSYLVRLWQAEQETTWRAVAQSVQSGETLHFAELESLFAFLKAQTAGYQLADHSNTVERR